MAKSFYIGERINPQFVKPYYNAYGQLSKKDALKKEDCIYGSMELKKFNSKEEYENELKKLEEEGYRINR